ncbi:hypothetical protein ES702_00401 [subsurface metagenome]
MQIWITPVTHQIQTSDAYHGYWQDDLYSINPELGTVSPLARLNTRQLTTVQSNDLKNLSSQLHDRGMYLMLDVVANHFAWTGPPNETYWTDYKPFNGEQYFHPPAVIDYTDNQTSVETGWLVVDPTPVVLPDVNTTRQDVRDLYYAWIADLVANYSVDGLRVDTVKHVEQSFWPGFNKAAGIYAVGEVFETQNLTYLCDYQNYLDAVLNYGPYNQIHEGFINSTGNLFALAEAVLGVQEECKDVSLLGSFMENHDNPRFPNATTDILLAANAISFTMLADGIPIIYQGQEQHFTGGQDPHNREAVWLSGYNESAYLYGLITTLNTIRTAAFTNDEEYLTTLQIPVYVDPNTIALRKGNAESAVLGVYTNVGSNGSDYNIVINGVVSGFAPNSTAVDLISCNDLTVGGDGSLAITVSGGNPSVCVPLPVPLFSSLLSVLLEWRSLANMCCRCIIPLIWRQVVCAEGE